jgi:phosphoribosylformylglycinamidine cyclo-ligase
MAKRRKPMTYRDAGVDIDVGDRFAASIMRTVRSTHGPRVISNQGGFAGLFALNFREELFRDNYVDPVMVACTDGVGTKLKIAFETGLHNTVGIDLVAMSANDLVVLGATPLFFLDYIATSKVELEVLHFVIEGIAEGCHQAGMALLGGETAEMPDFYTEGEYDLAGFAVGVVEREKILDGRHTRPGDLIIGMDSNGLHSNGFSLVRRVLLKRSRMKLDAWVDELGDYLAEELLKPTRIYTRAADKVLRKYKVRKAVRGFAHITGGGLPGNLCRVLPNNCDAVVDLGAWEPSAIFGLIQSRGKIDEAEMYRVFNMGIGFIVVANPSNADAIVGTLAKEGFPSRIIGEVREGDGEVRLVK